MKKISNDVGLLFRSQIYLDTIPKIIRGMIRGIFFNKKEGLLFVGKKVKIMNSQNIELGRNVKFESYSEIQGLANEKIIFGNNVTIGKGVQIRPSSYYGVGHIGDGLVIEDNSSIGPNGFIGCAGKVQIGKQVMIGPNVTIIAENHNFNDQNMTIKNQGVNQKGVKISDNVWIGANVTILDGVYIHSNTVIGANTLVTKDIPANTVFYNKRTPILKER
ncbi:acyltransferase [Weissella paramesenteroides]|uniref:acyltransferase n=1 Tax=Weissella paramesenteroides TaxID=1249 RepID=UPI003D35FCBA